MDDFGNCKVLNYLCMLFTVDIVRYILLSFIMPWFACNANLRMFSRSTHISKWNSQMCMPYIIMSVW